MQHSDGFYDDDNGTRGGGFHDNERQDRPIRWNPFLLRWERWDILVNYWFASHIYHEYDIKMKRTKDETELFYTDTWCDPTKEDLSDE